MVKECVIFLCLFGVTVAAVIQNSQPIESNAAAVADQIVPEEKKSNDDNSDLETAEFKHFFKRKLGFGVPVAVPVAAPVYVQQVAVPVQPVIQPVHYQHVHTPDCGCNGGGHHQSNYGYNYNYHYSYK